MANKLIPLSSTGIKAVGKTHNQRNPDGSTGIPVGNVEVENGEVINDNGDGTSSIFSNRLLVPNTNYSFAQASEQILLAKAKVEKKYLAELDKISKTFEGMSPTSPLRNHNGNLRTAEKQTQDSIEIKKVLDDYDAELLSLVQLQELVKKENGIENPNTEEEMPQYAGGAAKINTNNLKLQSTVVAKTNVNIPPPAKGSGSANKSSSTSVTGNSTGDAALGVGLQALSSIATAASGWMAAEKMRKNPIPQAHTVRKQSIRTKYDVSSELNDIARSEASTLDYVKQNSANSNVANAIAASIGARSADARGRVYARKFNAESQLDARQAQMDQQTEMYNAQMETQADQMAYNHANYVTQLQHQATTNLMDTAYNLVAADKKQASEEYQRKLLTASSPDAVRKDMEILDKDYQSRLPFGIKIPTKAQRGINKQLRQLKRKN